MLSADEALNLWKTREKQHREWHDEMTTIAGIYTNSVEIDLPEAAEGMTKPAVPNLLAQGVDQTAGRIASVVPTCTFTSENPGSRAPDRRAKTASRTLTGWWQADRLPLKMRRRARHLIAYAAAPVVIDWNTREHRPTWQVRDPRTCYPSKETYGDMFTPTDVIFTYKRNIGWLIANGYGAQVQRLAGVPLSTLHRDTQMTLIEYVYPAGRCLYLTGYGTPWNGEQTWTPPPEWNMGMAGKQRAEVLQMQAYPNELMVATVPTRISLDGPQGQFDNMVDTFLMQAQLTALELLAVQKGIFPDVYAVSNPGEVPAWVEGPFDGRTGKVSMLQGGRIQTEQYTPGYMTEPMQNRLERSSRLSAGIPAEFGGESGDNIRTARRGDAVLSGQIDHPIAEAQEVFQYALAEENRIAINLAKMIEGDVSRTIYVNVGNEMTKVTYKADEVFTHDQHVVAYPMVGNDINTLLMANGQRVGLGTMSKRTAMETDPAIANPETEHDRIIAEGLEAALVGGIQQQAAQGAIPPLIVARVMDLVATDKMELADALNKAAQEAAEKASAAQAAQQQGLPQAPDASAMAAGPGAAALTGSPIPGPSQGTQDLGALMSAVRKPVMSVTPGRGVEQGAV